MSITISLLEENNPELELNVSNSNFYALWCALFGDSEFNSMYSYGEVTPNDLLAALDRFDPKTIKAKTITDGNFISFGRTAEQVAKYYWTLRRIAIEGKKLNMNIIWG